MTRSAFRHEAMNTYFEIIIADQIPNYARQAADAAFRELDRLEGELSRFIETSDITRANRLAPGQTIAIGHDALECLLQAAAASALTGRAFDPAYATARTPGLPAEHPPFTLDPATHTLTSRADRLALDLGAIGKGYALDRMADLLTEWDITAASLNSGGSTLLALDAPAGESGWKSGIGDGIGRRVVPLVRAALSASGTTVKGSHLVDPRSGVPAARVIRAWALAPTAVLSDALSTAFFVLAPEDVAQFCAEHSEIGAALTLPDGCLQTEGRLRA